MGSEFVGSGPYGRVLIGRVGCYPNGGRNDAAPCLTMPSLDVRLLIVARVDSDPVLEPRSVVMSVSLPTPGGLPYVTDGGLENDLIYNRGFDLEQFAAFPLVYDEQGRAALADYYAGYADIARQAGVGLVLAAPTWRANPDWAERIGYDARATDRANRDAVALMKSLRDGWTDLPNVVVSGVIGPRGDGYVAGERPQPGEAADYHRGQIESIAEAGADLVEAITMTTPQEAAGIVRTANTAGLPVGILFTVEIDGTLPDGSLQSGRRPTDLHRRGDPPAPLRDVRPLTRRAGLPEPWGHAVDDGERTASAPQGAG